MKNQSRLPRCLALSTRALVMAVTGALIGACGSTADTPSGAIAITVKPGDTGTCDTSPCQVSLVMPPGTGVLEVTANEVRVGNFPAGQTVQLGEFFSSQAFKIKGADVPPAYVYIPQEP